MIFNWSFHKDLPSGLEHARYREQAEISDDHFTIVIEDIFGLHVFMDDALSMQIAHSLKE